MKIYIDLILILNFLFDLLILITLSYVLRRNVKSIRLILGGLIGSLTTLFLFTDMNTIELFMFKIIISIIMTIITFSYRNIRYTIKNLSYLYIISIILGGFLYFLNITFSYKNEGLIFYNNGLSVNFIFLIVFSPIILSLYSKQVKELKNNYSNYYKVDIYLNNNIIKTNAYLDTGNKLVDCYFKRPVIILNKRKMIYDINNFKTFLVPYNTIGNKGLLKCIKPDKIIIKGIGEIKKVLIGISDENFKINGVDLILNIKIMEDI